MNIDLNSPEWDFLDRVEEVKQGSGAWLQARCGNITGSNIAKVLNFKRDGKPSAERETYKMQVICERLTGIPTEHYVSGPMEHGTEMEPFARAQYEIQSGNTVDLVGYVPHPSIPRASGSPDGVIGDEGMIEIKAPNTTTHVGWLMAGEVPEQHEPQMMFYLACTGRKWCDFVSMDGRLPEHLQLFVKRLERNDERIAAIEAAVVTFNAEIEAVIAQLNALK